DVSAFDAQGQTVIEISAIKCEHVPDARPGNDWGAYAFQTRWYPRSLPTAMAAARADVLPTPSRIAAFVPQPDILTKQFDRRRHYEEFEPQIDALCAAYVLEAFRRMGWSPEAGEHVNALGLAPRLGVI